MTDTEPDVQYRRKHEASGDAVEVREEVPTDAGTGEEWYAIRMPISSTAEARDGEAFTRDRLTGWVRQINEGTIPVFADHGRNDGVADSRYSAFGKLGYYDNADIEERGDVVDLVADMVVLDPAKVHEATGDYREALAILKTQAEAGMPLTASVGWSEDTGDRDVPGGADLLEGSVVGIPSDARADSSQSAEPAPLARAVSAASTDFDVATFLRELAQTRPFGPPGGDGDEFDDFDDCVEAIMEDNPDMSKADAEALCGSWQEETKNVVDVGGEEIDLTPPDAVQNAAVMGLAKDDEFEPDCGTGAGRQSARQIADDSVTAERIDDIAAYLTSHEEDVTADGPPSDWSDDEWQDCGNLQYALWGGTGTGTGLEWAQRKANQVADATDEELPYPERSTAEQDMTDDDTEPDEESGDTTDEQRMDMDEKMDEMREMLDENTRKTREMYEKMMNGDDGDGDMDEESADGDEERDTESDETRTIEIDGEERSVDEVREEIETLRGQAGDAEPEEPETTDRAADEDSETDDSGSGGWGMR